MAKARFCGGYRLGETLKIVNGIITVATEMDEPTGGVSTCGQLYDDKVFTIVRIDGTDTVTSIGVEPDMDATKPVSICGFAGDSRYFEINGRTLDFHERYLLQVHVTPAEATVSVTHEETPVEPFPGTLVFPMDETDGTYAVSVSCEGYTPQEQEVEASENQLIEIELVPV